MDMSMHRINYYYYNQRKSRAKCVKRKSSANICALLWQTQEVNRRAECGWRWTVGTVGIRMWLSL